MPQQTQPKEEPDTMDSIQRVTYRTVQGQERPGYFEGVSHKMTGELLITDTETERQVFIQPTRVYFGD